jgi:hypothetical protein
MELVSNMDGNGMASIIDPTFPATYAPLRTASWGALAYTYPGPADNLAPVPLPTI